VLFAEASKDVVDFLFSLLSLPVSTVVRLLWTDSMAGSARNLYASFHKLDGAYVLSEDNRNALLFPTLLSQAAAANMSLLRLPDPSPKGFFRCVYCNSLGYVTDEWGTKCPRCHNPMKVAVECVRPDSGSSGQVVTTGGARGFVQGIVTYTVTDSLKVTPMSSISSITLLSTLGVRDFGGLQEKTVRLGYSEVSIPRLTLCQLLNRFTSD
jgi:hypothetical protein